MVDLETKVGSLLNEIRTYLSHQKRKRHFRFLLMKVLFLVARSCLGLNLMGKCINIFKNDEKYLLCFVHLFIYL